MPNPSAAATFVASAMLSSFPTVAQESASADTLIVRLTDVGQRAAARERLIALGAAAVPAIAKKLPEADGVLRPELLSILIELGPAAGDAVPQVLDLVSDAEKIDRNAIDALAALVPWRAADVVVDTNSLIGGFYTRFFNGGSPAVDDWIAWQRLHFRAAFPRARDLDLDALVTNVRASNPLRVEIAVELLGHRGPAARSALPDLRRILERPEPRILTTERTVALHAKAARATLAIAPDSDLAALARDVIAGLRPPPQRAESVMPQRLRNRIDDLVAQLARPEQREAAAANLVAIGEPAALATASVLSRDADSATVTAALAVLRALGRRGAAAVPQLVAAMSELPAEHCVSVLETQVATVPWSIDLMPFPTYSCGTGYLELSGRRVSGTVDTELLARVTAIWMTYLAARAVDPDAMVVELGALLSHATVEVRERTLVVIAMRGEPMRSLVPALGAMLEAEQPKEYRCKWVGNGVQNWQVDRTAHVHRLAAAAIVAVAPADDPLVAQARRILAQPEPVEPSDPDAK